MPMGGIACGDGVKIPTELVVTKPETGLAKTARGDSVRGWREETDKVDGSGARGRG